VLIVFPTSIAAARQQKRAARSASLEATGVTVFSASERWVVLATMPTTRANSAAALRARDCPLSTPQINLQLAMRLRSNYLAVHLGNVVQQCSSVQSVEKTGVVGRDASEGWSVTVATAFLALRTPYVELLALHQRWAKILPLMTATKNFVAVDVARGEHLQQIPATLIPHWSRICLTWLHTDRSHS